MYKSVLGVSYWYISCALCNQPQPYVESVHCNFVGTERKGCVILPQNTEVDKLDLQVCLPKITLNKGQAVRTKILNYVLS